MAPKFRQSENVLLNKQTDGNIDTYNASDFDKNKDDFTWYNDKEPHYERKKKILKAHPEIKELFGPEPLTLPLTLGLVGIQYWIGTWIGEASWPVYLLTLYCVGAVINHTLQLANHELSHSLCFESQSLNKLLGFVANFPTMVPSSATFRFYHMEHHAKQGVDGIDTDVPTDFELRFFKGPLLKFIWVCNQMWFYAVRPGVVKPITPDRWIIGNFLVQAAVDYWVYVNMGYSAVVYYLLCNWVGMGCHPCAGHFIAEHYEFVEGYETYSYIGPWNWVNFNVGYHIAHHDFPRIPWSRIWKVREIAPEWYEGYPIHTSYTRVLWNFIFDSELGSFARVKRPDPKTLKKSK